MEKSQCSSDAQKMRNIASKTTDLPLCFRSAARSLKDFYFTNSTSFLMKMTYYHQTSQDFNPVTINLDYQIYQSFDNDLEVKGVFLDLSKAFDKVWREELILKLSRNGMYGKLLYLLEDF